MTDLGTLGGNASSGDAINDTGQVTGFSYTREGERRVFITGSNGRGMAEAPFGKDDIGFSGLSINRDGMAINDMNNAGQVVGWYFDYGNYAHGFISGPGGVGVAELAGGSGEAVNSIGQVAVNSYNNESASITGPNGLGIRDLGTLGGPLSSASGINDAGQVVGWSHIYIHELFIHQYAFITGPNGVKMTDLGTLGGDYSSASDINDARQVVGDSDTAGGVSHAFVTGPNGTAMKDLNSLVDLPAGVTLTQAFAINNSGQILAVATVVPEPEIYALLLSGLALVGFFARRKTMNT